MLPAMLFVVWFFLSYNKMYGDHNSAAAPSAAAANTANKQLTRTAYIYIF